MDVDQLLADLARLFPLPVMAIRGESIVFLSDEAGELLGMQKCLDGSEGPIFCNYPLVNYFEHKKAYVWFRKNFLSSLVTERSFSTICPLKKREGGFFLARLRGRALEKGMPAEFFIAIEDLSGSAKEYNELYARFKGADEFLGKIIETLPFGILIVNDAGRIEYVNRTFAHRWGLDISRMAGSLMEEAGIYDNRGFLRNIRDALATGTSLKDVEYQYEGNDGKVKILLCDFHVLEFSDGKRRGMLIEADRTDSVMRRREAESLARNLDREIQERNRAIIEQEKLAAVGRLAAGITHELNTPTTYVRGNLQLIDHYSVELDKEMEHFILASDAKEQSASRERICNFSKTIQNAGKAAFLGTERIMNIIQSMRGFVRSDAEANNIINVYVPLRDSIVLTYNRIKRFGKVILDGWEFDPEDTASFMNEHLANVQGSAQRLSQLFVILVNNSIDAWNHKDTACSERLHIEIEVKARENRIHVIYCDNAGGMPVEIEEKVFEPFFTTRNSEGGTGLGLSIARQIVKEHKGEITLENYPGRGVCWHVSLPGAIEEKRGYGA